MLELVNLSNHCTDREIISNDIQVLKGFLTAHHLDGIEMLFCEPWDFTLHPKELISGVHLPFWPQWLDFWYGDMQALLADFGNQKTIAAYYGGLSPKDWLSQYRRSIIQALETEPRYLVFHVSQARNSELFSWQFHYDSDAVIQGAITLLNELVDLIPPDTALLLENLWWPGLTLRDKELTQKLLEGIRHDNVGIMLDTGHLMNTNQELQTQADGVDFILHTLEELHEYKMRIRGIHLHQSLSGAYVKQVLKNPPLWQAQSAAAVMEHILKIDEHKPFSCAAVQKIVESVQPDFLVHEFTQISRSDWEKKIKIQQRALGRIETIL